MRLATIDRDLWQLRSGEVAHEASPQTFWIPERSVRESLRPGQAAKLIFDIEAVDTQTGDIQTGGERMWVIVAEVIGRHYIGVLDNEPATIEIDEGFYLSRGAEIPFGPEHVIDVGEPPEDYGAALLAQPRSRRWSRA